MDFENLEDRSFDLNDDITDALSFISASPGPNNFANQTIDAGNIQPMISQCLIEEQLKRQVAQQLSAQQSQSQAYVSHQQRQNNHQQFFSEQQQQISPADYQQQQYQRSTVPQVQKHPSVQFHQSMTVQQRILAYQQQLQYNNSPSPPPRIPNQQPMVPRNFVPQQQLAANQQQYQHPKPAVSKIQNQQMQLQNKQFEAQNLQAHQPTSILRQQLSQASRSVTQQSNQQLQIKNQQAQLQNQHPQAYQSTLRTQASQSLTHQQQQQQQVQSQNFKAENQQPQAHQLSSQQQTQQSLPQQQDLQQQLQIQKQRAHLQNRQFPAHQLASQSLLQHQNLQIQKQQAQAHQQFASRNHPLTPDQRLLSVSQLKYQVQAQAQDLSQASQQQLTAKNQQPVYPTIGHQQQPTPAVNPSQKPHIEIIEQPATRGSRFRYGCEVRVNGSIPGVSSTPANKTCPTIRIVGYNGPAKIVVSCVTKDPPYYPHPHNLIGKTWSKDGICVYKMQKDQMIVTFEKLGIKCVKKKDFRASLELRERIKVDPFNTGFEHKNDLNSIDQSCVRLAFQAFIEEPTKEKFKIALPAVVSNPIYDKKNSPDLIIHHMSHSQAPVDGSLKIILLCDKVAKDDIQVRFYEEQDEEVVWEEFGNVHEYGFIHKHVAILFRTPTYRTIDICKPVNVFVELLRPSDGMSSKARQFEFTPVETHPIVIQRKRKRVDESVLKNLSMQNCGISRTILQKHDD